jgi:hypothetical protein
MTFAERMQVATLVLDYLKVVLGYPVTIPALVGFFCWLFREQIGAAVGRLLKASFAGASVELAQYTADITQTTKDVSDPLTPDQIKKAGEVIAIFFDLTARLLPFIPKADRRPFIEEKTKTLPMEFNDFRTALLKLAEDAPEAPALRASDQLRTTYRASLAELAGFKPIEPPRV